MEFKFNSLIVMLNLRAECKPAIPTESARDWLDRFLRELIYIAKNLPSEPRNSSRIRVDSKALEDSLKILIERRYASHK